jgi:hypothetical protein
MVSVTLGAQEVVWKPIFFSSEAIPMLGDKVNDTRTDIVLKPFEIALTSALLALNTCSKVFY